MTAANKSSKKSPAKASPVKASPVKEEPVKKSALKTKRNDKVEVKAESKRQMGVKFNEEANVEHVFGERRWNDFKTKGATFTKGNFTADEIKTLMNALCSYVKEHTAFDADPMETLTILCSRSKTEMPAELHGAWPKISESL